MDCTDCAAGVAAGGGTGGVVDTGGTAAAVGETTGAAPADAVWRRGSAGAAFAAGGSLSGSDADKITFQFRFSHLRP